MTDTTADPAPKKTVLTFAQRLEMHELLRANLFKREDGLWEFTNNFTDHRIAAALGLDGKSGNQIVARHRQSEFGDIYRTADNAGSLDARVFALEAQVTRFAADLCALMNSLGVQPKP